MRSIGGPQSVWPVEAQMDRIADALGLDPLQYRLKHLLGRDEQVRPNSRGVDGDLRQGLAKVAEMIRDTGPPTAGAGTGLAVGITDSEANPVSTAIVRLLSDGNVVVMAGSTEVGQGARTVLSQIAAEELCVPFERVMLRGTDTHTTPFFGRRPFFGECPVFAFCSWWVFLFDRSWWVPLFDRWVSRFGLLFSWWMSLLHVVGVLFSRWLSPYRGGCPLQSPSIAFNRPLQSGSPSSCQRPTSRTSGRNTASLTQGGMGR